MANVFGGQDMPETTSPLNPVAPLTVQDSRARLSHGVRVGQPTRNGR